MALIAFSSTPQILVAPAAGDPYNTEIDGLTVREVAEPVEADGLPDGALRYWVAIEKEVGSVEEALEARQWADALIQDLERAWAYAAGLPLRPVRTYLEVRYAPEGWTSNVEEVGNEIRAQEQRITGTLRIVSRHWMHAPQFPLLCA